MKGLFSALYCLGLLVGLSLFSQEPGEEEESTNQPLRVDFFGIHRIRDFEIPEVYEPGPPMRIDFEGSHSREKFVLPEPYIAGEPLRVDFEGTHSIR